MKNAILMFLPKSGIWPILCQLMAILAKCVEIWTSNLFYIDFDMKTKFEVHQTKIGHSIHK